MATNRLIPLTSELDASVRDCVARLASVDVLNERFRVSLPIMMPSGSLVDVAIYPEPGGTFMVTDDGSAFNEASNYGVTPRSFSSIAKRKSFEAGVEFDGFQVLMIRVAPEQLRVSLILIGNLAKEVAADAVESSLRAKSSSAKDKLYDRIEQAFPGRTVVRDVELAGNSTAVYSFDAMVETEVKPVIFDIFSKEPASINATFIKLADLARLEFSPALIGVTRDPDKIGPKLTMISSVAKIIRLDAAASTFKKAAA